MVLAHRVDGGGPSLLLLNGGLMSLGAWDEYIPSLATAYRVVRCDFRGQLLGPGPLPPSFEGHAHDLAELLDLLAIDAAHLVGTSFGALVGLLFAALHPDRVRSLTAVTATDRIRPEASAASLALIDACREAARGGDGGRVLDLVVPHAFSGRYLATHADLVARRRAQIAALPRAWFEGLAGLIGSLEGLDLTPWLGRIRCPTLVVAAENDRTFPVEEARALAAAIPGARLEVVPDAAHGLVVEDPKPLMAILNEFLVPLTCEQEGRS